MNNNIIDSISKEKQLDFSVVEKPLDEVIEFFINSIDRGFPLKNIPGARDFFLSLAYVARNIYRSIRYISAEKPEDFNRKIEYSLSSIILIRTILEEVFTIVFISIDLKNRLSWYYRSGWGEQRETHERLLTRYKTNSKWEEWFKESDLFLQYTASKLGISTEEIKDPKRIKYFPIPSKMKSDQPLPPEIDQLFQYLEDYFYKHFSQVAHLSWPGLSVMAGSFLTEDEAKKEFYLKKMRSDRIFHVITLLLALFSEIGRILALNQRSKLSYLWKILSEFWGDAQELYEMRYRNLLVETTSK